jgi:hypothetical protein
MKTFWKIDLNWFSRKHIIDVTAESETKKSIWIDNVCYRKKTKYIYYFETYEEAYEKLISYAKEKVEEAKERSNSAQRVYEEIRRQH